MVAKIEITVDSVTLVYDKSRLKQILRSAGNEVANLARSLIRHASGGGKKGASLPGQPPRSLSGNLASSIKVKMLRSGEGVAIRDYAIYALSLEAGAAGGGKGLGNPTRSHKKRTLADRIKSAQGLGHTRILMPRPFLSAALEQEENSISERIKTAVTSGMKFEKHKFK
jgi:hypothetical protein